MMLIELFRKVMVADIYVRLETYREREYMLSERLGLDFGTPLSIRLDYEMSLKNTRTAIKVLKEGLDEFD